MILRHRTAYLVHPALQRITKFLPNNPPGKGSIVLVDGVEGIDRCWVVADPPLDWEGLDWKLRGPIKVVVAPQEGA